MRTLIEASTIVKAGGSTRHLQNFIVNLDRTTSDNTYFLAIRRNIEDLKLPSNLKKIKVIRIDKSSLYKRMKYLFYDYKKIIKKYEIDIIVSLVNIGFVRPPIPQINFQQNSLMYYKHHLKDLKLKEKIMICIKRKLLIGAMKNSVYVVTPTLAMQDMIKCFIKNQINFIVLSHALNYQELKNPGELPEEIMKKFKNNFIKVLYISHFMPHKNHLLLIDAINLLKQRDWKIKLYMTIDEKDWLGGYDILIGKIKKLDLKETIELLPRVPASEVSNLYLMSDIFVFPSLCESFGFPMMEAMACELPLVVADTPVNREICDDAALYHDPNSSANLADKIEIFLKNPKLLLEYKNKSYERFNNRNITWEEYVKKFEEILESISRGGTVVVDKKNWLEGENQRND